MNEKLLNWVATTSIFGLGLAVTGEILKDFAFIVTIIVGISTIYENKKTKTFVSTAYLRFKQLFIKNDTDTSPKG